MPKFWAHLSLKYIPKWPKGGEWEQRRHCVCPKKFLQSFHFSTNWTVWSICHPLPFEGPCLIVGSVINGHFIRMLTIIWLIVTLRGLAYFHILIDLISNNPWWYITSVTFLLSLSKQVHLPNRKFQCHQPRLEEFLWLWTFILLLLVAHFFHLPQSSISIRGMPKLPTNCSSIIVAMGPTCLATFIFHLQSVLNECDVLSFVAGFRCK